MLIGQRSIFFGDLYRFYPGFIHRLWFRNDPGVFGTES